MTLNFLIILSLVQGITEFLPISSSAHLILIPYFTQNVYEGRGFDVSLHFGCLIAVIIYLRNDLKSYISQLKIYPKTNFNLEFIKIIIIGSIPIIFFGLIIKLVNLNFEKLIELIGWTTLIFGIILGISDTIRVKKKKN